MPDRPQSLRTEIAARRAQRRKTSHERHAAPGWFEWTLREFARYMYVLGFLALLLMGPLQMAVSWLPEGSPPVVDPLLVGLMMILFAGAAFYLGAHGYLYIWRDGGYVDRAVKRREDRLAPSAGNLEPRVKP